MAPRPEIFTTRRNLDDYETRTRQYEAKLAGHRAKYNRLHDEIATHGKNEIRRILDELNKRLKRHHFYFSQGMGSQAVWCDGGVFGDEIASMYFESAWSSSDIRRGGYSEHNEQRFPVMVWIGDRVRRIMDIAEKLDDEFRAHIGDIGRSKDSKDGKA